MKFKRIDDNTIRCVITKEDMDENGLELDDFFTQTEKVQDFLREVVEQASEKVGYESKHGMVSLQIMPLPNQALAITFSENETEDVNSMVENLKEILQDAKKKGVLQDGDSTKSDNAKLLDETVSEKKKVPGVTKQEKKTIMQADTRVFAFTNLRFVMQFAHTVQEKRPVVSSLYKDIENAIYYLVLEKGRLSVKNFNVICTNATEFSTYIQSGPQYLHYLREHGELIIDRRAVKALARL